MIKPDSQLLFEHREFLIIYKPDGLNFHDENEQPGLFSQWQSQRKEKLWPVHRLDKPTSGLVILARTQKAADRFRFLFSRHLVTKCYIAISDRKPGKKQGLIKGDMLPARNGCWRLSRSTENPAITRFDSQSIAPGLRLFRLFPKTGKTHQLRVMMKSLGCPITGDHRYKGSEADRCYLHALALSFEFAGETWRFIAPPVSGELFQQQSADFYQALVPV